MTEPTVAAETGRRDVVGMAYSLAFFVLGCLALYHTDGMSALGAIFPQTIATALIIFSLAYIAQNLVSPASVQPASGQGSWLRRGLLVAVMLIWVVSLNWLGFLAASVAGFLGMILVGNYDAWSMQRFVIYTVVSAMIIGGFYVLFAVVLNVPLPAPRW